ncbi:uncharacterized protein LOC5508361 [Nematostella vectensis]|uniref:uncharacterized protein LOC5508361 n=1 Tax=Nematostella vectensis TaxID=45351 RepID=UPI0020773BB6|nr:uncharacterized protein LOC5508361 [Nematostella vectensis]
MSKLKCECLNITVHVQTNASRETEGKDFVSESCTNVFFAGKLLEVELAVGGIKMEVESLIRSNRVEDWDVYSCLNCSMDCYALHSVKGYDRVLVNKSLESDPEVLRQRSSSKNFSLPFKILLQHEAESSHEGNNLLLLGQDSVTVAMASVQEALKKYLKSEEAAMKERIRQYTEQQQQNFMALQSQALKDKSSVYRVISKAQEKTMESSLHEAMFETPETIGANIFHSPGHEGPLNLLKTPKHVNQVHITQVNTARPLFEVGSPSLQSNIHRVRRKPPRPGQKSAKPATADADPLFALDGFTDDCEPFFESEEDEISSSDNSFQNEEPALPRHIYIQRKKPQPVSQYSSSVPISMPTIVRKPHSWEDEEEFAMPEPDKIGESMKALARSVQNNTEDMFGELPRPRLFTEPRLTSSYFSR